MTSLHDWGYFGCYDDPAEAGMAAGAALVTNAAWSYLTPDGQASAAYAALLAMGVGHDVASAAVDYEIAGEPARAPLFLNAPVAVAA